MEQFDDSFWATSSDDVEKSLDHTQTSLDFEQLSMDPYQAGNFNLGEIDFEDSYDPAEHEKLQNMDITQQPFVCYGDAFVDRYTAPDAVSAHLSASSFVGQEQVTPPMPSFDGTTNPTYFLPSQTYPDPEQAALSTFMQRIDPTILPAGAIQGQAALPLTPYSTPAAVRSSQPRRYRNSILNKFKRPSLPLRVIDSQSPFEGGLKLALERELELEVQRERAARAAPTTQNRNVVPSAALIPESMPVIRKKAGNKRSENIANFNASDYYEPLAVRPASWGPIDHTTGEHLFQYNKEGELLPHLTFSTEQMQEYVSRHPLHQGVRNLKKSNLVFWIQTCPADSSKRYPDKNSDKCRFTNCPDACRTIRKGEYRIMFDERHPGKRNCDPFHNAGYVHLYCMEKFIDFPDMCKNFRVKADAREHLRHEGKNKMAITRDYAEMEGIVLDFVAHSQPWNGVRPNNYYGLTLCSQLSEHYLSRQSATRQHKRKERDGNDVSVHRNNLDVKVDNDNKIKAAKLAVKGKRPTLPKPQPRATGSRKRKSTSVDDEEFVPDPHILHRNPTTSSSKGELAAPRKKRKISSDSLESNISEESAEISPRSTRGKKRSFDHEETVEAPPTKLRRSSRTSRNNSWADDFHNPGLRF